MDTELVVLVDDNNNEIGTMPKLAAHHGDTPLHRAFSSYVFNEEGKFLLTQRGKKKKVWPGIWTNSCCGHPGPGESTEDALKRRLSYELGLTPVSYEVALPHFRYRVTLDGIVENEICPVYLVRVSGSPKPNAFEVEDYQFIDWDNYVKDVLENPKQFSEWSYLQVKELHELTLVNKYSKKL